MAEIIWLSDLDGTQIAALQAADSIEVEDRLQDTEQLRFNLRIDDPKAALVVEDSLLRYKGRFYRCSQPQQSRDATNGPVVSVIAEAIWAALVERIQHGVFSVIDQPISGGLGQIIAGSGWTVGTVEADGGSYSLQETDATVLGLVREWAGIVGREVVFDTAAKTISLARQQGTDTGVGFRYGFNLDSITRTSTPPQATRLWPYGSNNLDVSSVNPTGQPYVEDFTWYTDQGVPLDVAKARYLKEQVWVNTSYLAALPLFDAARAYLNLLSRPRVSYQATVLDVSALTGWPADAWALGDTVRVFDEPLGIALTARVVRLLRRPLEPQRNEIELSFSEATIGQATATTARTGLTEATFALLVDENAGQLALGAGLMQMHSFALTFPGQGNVVIGYDLSGLASVAAGGTVTLTFWWGTEQVGPTIPVDFSAGEHLNIAAPISLVGLTGSDDLIIRAQVTAGAGTVSIPAGNSRAYLMVSGALGGGVSTAPKVDVNDSVDTTAGLQAVGTTATATLTTPIGVTRTDAVDTTADLAAISDTTTPPIASLTEIGVQVTENDTPNAGSHTP